MALTSLVIRIGADDQSIQKALASVGQRTKSLDADISKLGDSPIAVAAQKSLAQLQSSMKSVSDAHQRLADRAVQAARGLEVMGGASKLTTDELAQMHRVATRGVDAFKAMGQEAPPALLKMQRETQKATAAGQGFNQFLGKANTLLGAFGVGLSIGAVVGFGKELLRMGDQIQKVADRTGLTTKEVQQLSYVAEQSGNSLEEMTGAIAQLQNRVGSGDKSAVGAVKALGLNLEQLKNASPAEQLELIATKAAQIKDPMDLTRASMDLFGKSGSIILPTLVSDFAKLRKEAPLMSDATVKALDQAGDQLGRFGLQIKVWAAESYNAFGGAFDFLVKWAYKGAAALADVAVGIVKTIEKMPGGGKVLKAFGTDIAAMTANAEWFRDAAKAMEARTDAVAVSATKAAPKLKLFNADTEKAAASAQKAATEFATLAEKVRGLEAGLATVPDALQKVGRSYDEAKLGPLAAAVAQVEQRSHIAAFGFKGMVDELKNVGQAGEDTAREMARLEAAFTFTGPIQQSVASLGQSLKNVLQGVPQMVANALTGGGGILGALQGIGSQIGSTLGERIGKALGLAGPIGSAIGSLAGSLIGMFGKLFTSAEKAVNPIREAFVQGFKTIGRDGLDVLNQKAATAGVTLRAMLDAKNPQQYKTAIDSLNAALAFQDNAMAALDATIGKYGLTIEELGPAMRRQELDKQAQELFQDWQVLNAAGVDTVTITSKMSGAINDYVQRAVKMGAEVPAAMKPMLQNMVEQGLLTDSAGNKITDLEKSGISFAQTMSQGFESVVKEVKNLAEAISRGIGGAINNLPTTKTIGINFDVEPLQLQTPVYGAGGGLVTHHGIVQSFASGGRVLPFMRRGTDSVPAMLTPGERVLSVQETQAYDTALSIGGASNAGMEARLDAIERLLARSEADGPRRLSRAVVAAIQTAGLRR